MFGALPMRRVVLYLLREELERASLVLARTGVLDPEPVAGAEDLAELPGADFAATYHGARLRYDKIVHYLGAQVAAGSPESKTEVPLEPVSREELAALDERLVPLWQECGRLEERQRRLHERRTNLRQQWGGLETFARLDVDLGLLQQEHRFLDVRVGTLDQNQVERLRDALGLTGHSVLEFHREEDVAQVAIVGLQGFEDEVRSVLKAAGFHRLEVPAEMTGHPEQLRAELASRTQALDAEQAEIDTTIESLRSTHQGLLHTAADQLAAAAPLSALAANLRSRGGLVRVEGWVPACELPRLRDGLAESVSAFHLESRRPTREELPTVPSIQRYPAWMAPFSSLVRGYGTPRYDEFDPTWLFAISFTLMFGMMFGDVGHGLVIAAAAWWLRDKLGVFTRFGVIAGLSSTVFGFLYGSIFGFEHLMHPVWMSPLSDPMRLLILALYWGIGFILVATSISAWNLWRSGNRRRALLGVKGVVGLVFYIGTLVTLMRMAQGGDAGWLELALIGIPLLVMLVEIWRETEASGGERALVTFMEGFEAVMGYVSNTLSFLRVAAFSLNHAALAIAVMTLAGMLDTAGHWITVVIGNLIILVLEGGIVLIQVLRLEYYEGFARFFSGDGRPYRPLTLRTSADGRPEGA